MPPSSRIPPLLQPFVRAPNDDSLLLLTSTLDASANWLVARFLCDALSPGGGGGGDSGTKKVLLVSWMRDHDFWRHEVRKGTGLDLTALRAQGRFAFVDGLSALFLHPEDDAEADHATAPTAPPGMVPATRGSQTLPARGPPGRTPTTRVPPGVPPRASTSSPGLYTLASASLDHLNATMSAALAFLGPSAVATSTLVILDNPDILLASVPALTPFTLTSFFLTLHTHPHVSHVVVHLQSDMSLIAPSSPPQPLQVAQQNLVVKTAHMSGKVLGLRVLDTGVARDVSGVLRATVHRDSWANIRTVSDEGGGGDGHVEGPKDQASEVLYKVYGDGSVRVFERGTEVNA